MYERIREDKYIEEIFDKLEIEEQNDNNFWAYHGEIHTMNVISVVENILVQLNYDSVFVEHAKIAALLHDMGVIYGKENHALNSYNMAKEYFGRNNIDTGNNEDILDAILNHSNGFGRNNPIAAALMFADKIDIKKDRVAKEGYNVVGMRQLQYINDIKINIDIIDKHLHILFVVDELADRQELESFYFIDKVFKAIAGFAKENGLDYKVFYNSDIWELNK